MQTPIAPAKTPGQLALNGHFHSAPKHRIGKNGEWVNQLRCEAGPKSNTSQSGKG